MPVNRMTFHGIFCLATYFFMLLPTAASNDPLTDRGKRIFLGRESIVGKIDGHADSLSPALSKCVNCHGSATRSNLEEKFAPHLDRSWLLDIRSRRGGPPF